MQMISITLTANIVLTQVNNDGNGLIPIIGRVHNLEILTLTNVTFNDTYDALSGGWIRNASGLILAM
jgi:hypothetical protein